MIRHMGRNFSVVLIFIVSSFLGCDDSYLSKICIQSQPCIISNDIVKYEGLSNDDALGACVFGKTACDDNNDVKFCLGYIGPSEEICDDIDNDCDGTIDEGFDKDGDGVKTCKGDCDDYNARVFSGRAEVCNGIDDDCDGVIDQVTRGCWTGPSGVSTQSPAVCHPGIMLCDAGRWLGCEGQRLPDTYEICNGLDDDCDGEVDETERDICGPSSVKGACELGDRVCIDDETVCLNAVYPTTETCNNIDDDCDGATDESIQERICYTACGAGAEHCEAGGWLDCTAPAPTPEQCDGIDNDCDGDVDENCPCMHGQLAVCKQNIVDRATGDPVMCGYGITTCDINGVWGPCYWWDVEPELCDNWDNDCDGAIDGMQVTCGDPTYAGRGECRLGAITCEAGVWGQCEGEVVPTPEICDGLDNDCDDEIDEDLNPHDKVDILFLIDGSGSMCSKADAFRTAIAVYSNDFAGTEHQFALAVYPGRVRMDDTVDILIPLSDFASFNSSLHLYDCDYSGIEPGWDAAYEVTDPVNPMLAWRADTSSVTGAYPYIIIITDEHPNQGSLIEANVTARMYNCFVGSCVQGDKWEIFVITPNLYWSEWDEPTFGDHDRLIDMDPVNAQRYTDILRDIFSEICR